LISRVAEEVDRLDITGIVVAAAFVGVMKIAVDA
jgi:hypothetical protein